MFLQNAYFTSTASVIKTRHKLIASIDINSDLSRVGASPLFFFTFLQGEITSFASLYNDEGLHEIKEFAP